VRPNTLGFSAVLFPIAIALFFPLLAYTEVVEDGPNIEKSPVLSFQEMCEAAAEAFVPKTPADVDRSRDELNRVAKCLDERLAMEADRGVSWREYVQLDELISQLDSKDGPDLEVLDNIQTRLSKKHEGLGMVWFVDVRRALNRHQLMVRALNNEKLVPQYKVMLRQLADQLTKYARNPSPEASLQIGAVSGWLNDIKLASDLSLAIRERLSRPNLFLILSDDLVKAAIEEPIRENTIIEDCILGTTVTGTGDTTGKTVVNLVPDADMAVFDIKIFTDTESETVGRNGPAIICSSGVTEVRACKRLWFDENGMDSHPTVAKAESKTTINSVRSASGRRIVEKVARNRVAQRKSQAEAIGAEHAEERVCNRVDREVQKMIDKANDAFITRLKRPLSERNMFAQSLDTRTTEDAFCVQAKLADIGQLAAPSGPPTIADNLDLSMRLHESMVNNLAATAFSGITLTEERFLAAVKKTLGKLPEELKREEGKEPWTIVFARQQPISVLFGNDGISVTIRAREFHRGDSKYPGMYITAKYKIEKTPEDDFKAVLRGDLLIYPQRITPGSAGKLSSREITIRNLLARRFEKIFKNEMVIKPIELQGKFSKVGKLLLSQWTAEHGWLAMGWKMEGDRLERK